MENDEGKRITSYIRPTVFNTRRPIGQQLHRLERNIPNSRQHNHSPLRVPADTGAQRLDEAPIMYKTIDLRDEDLPTIVAACNRIAYYRAHYPTLKEVIISRTQRQTMIEHDPVMYAQTLLLAQQYEKAPTDLDFKMILEHCEVIVE